MTTDFRALCAELLDEVVARPLILDRELIARARAALAEPEPKGPTDEDLQRLMYFEFTTSTGHGERVDEIGFARAVLDRWGRPAAAPVPVSERLPGPEDCDAEGRCWLGGHLLANGTPTWLLGYPAWAERFPDVHHFWLPANALPLPAPEGGEVSR